MGAVDPEISGLPAHIDQRGALQDLLEIQKVFDHFEVPLFLTFGALLGVYRDKKFIKYDDDLDLCVTAKIDHRKRKEIGRMLLNIGFMPQPIGFNVYGVIEPSEAGYNGTDTTGIIVCQKRVRVTIFFFAEEPCDMHERDMVCIPKYGGKRLISTPARFFDKPDTIKFKGHTFLTPSPIKEYLAFTYGEDWKTPIKGKHALQWGEMHEQQGVLE